MSDVLRKLCLAQLVGLLGKYLESLGILLKRLGLKVGGRVAQVFADTVFHVPFDMQECFVQLLVRQAGLNSLFDDFAVARMRQRPVFGRLLDEFLDLDALFLIG